MDTNTKPIRSYNKPKPPKPRTCKGCIHFSLGYRMRSNGYCIKKKCNTLRNSICVFYKGTR